MNGTIVSIQGHGTIVSLTIAETDAEVVADEGRLVHFDHSCFRWMLESVAGGDPRQLLGREVHYQEDPGEDGLHSISFDDIECDHTQGVVIE